ncbi:thioredoxin family protein [Rapidithrix thailandica]|uniref:Thioredoxin family protein n=1 Tax=Rapidithrix thailandica TaxID=413964 RepID=A0AAW9S8W6_9BACT
MTNQLITQEVLDNAYSYPAYMEMLKKLLAEGKTTGNNHSDEYVFYAEMNMQRMERIDKSITLSEETTQALQQIQTPVYWVVLTEGWCGDAAQNLPILHKMSLVNPKIQLKLILRDEHLDIMDAYLTNGGRSIPKLICLKADNLQETGTWGPRPAPLQEMMAEFKKQANGDQKELIISMQKWYAKDKALTLQKEFIQLLEQWDIKA